MIVKDLDDFFPLTRRNDWEILFTATNRQNISKNPKEIETILRFSSGRFAFPSNDSPINEWLQFYANLSNIIIGLALEIRCVFP